MTTLPAVRPTEDAITRSQERIADLEQRAAAALRQVATAAIDQDAAARSAAESLGAGLERELIAERRVLATMHAAAAEAEQVRQHQAAAVAAERDRRHRIAQQRAWLAGQVRHLELRVGLIEARRTLLAQEAELARAVDHLGLDAIAGRLRQAGISLPQVDVELELYGRDPERLRALAGECRDRLAALELVAPEPEADAATDPATPAGQGIGGRVHSASLAIAARQRQLDEAHQALGQAKGQPVTALIEAARRRLADAQAALVAAQDEGVDTLPLVRRIGVLEVQLQAARSHLQRVLEDSILPAERAAARDRLATLERRLAAARAEQDAQPAAARVDGAAA